MIVTKIGDHYTLHIPDEYHDLIRVGQDVSIAADELGRLVITPIEQIEATLKATFGMWSDRPEAQTDSVDFVSDLRQGNRLDQFALRP